MSQRRVLLLGLLVIPLILFSIILGTSGNPDDQQSGLQIISILISVPIIFINIWEWQQPVSLDLLIRPNFIKRQSDIKIPGNSSGIAIILAIGGLLIIYMFFLVFGSTKQSGEAVQILLPPESTMDIGAIQTEAVQTALAGAVPTSGENPIIVPTQIFRATRQPPVNPGSGPTATEEPGGLGLELVQTVTQSPLTPTGTQIVATVDTGDLISFTGSGDKVIDFEKWDGPAILEVTHNGEGAFSVVRYVSSDATLDFLVNTTGTYFGTLPIDFLPDEETNQLTISTESSWKVRILPINQARTEILPATIQGNGDDVIVLSGGKPDLITINATLANAGFVVRGLVSGDWEYLVDETAPYSASFQINPEITVISVFAEGPWAIQLTLKQ